VQFSENQQVEYNPFSLCTINPLKGRGVNWLHLAIPV